MCGICGVVGIEAKEASEAIVRRMLASIEHRGPDEEGVLLVPRAAVGARRLSIIDLQGGSQPIWNEDGTLAVVFNGEIYNHRELRGELEANGHRFRTQSDTEVIVHAYESWGEGCVRRFKGMFAFAIVEMPHGVHGPAARVFLARDPLGIKPLYYTQSAGAVLFASEVRALLASQHARWRLSSEALSSYLLFGSAGEPLTLVEGVFSVLPGHSMSVSAGGPSRILDSSPYWDIGQFTRTGTDTSPSHGKDPSPAGKVRALFEYSVQSHLIADVPVGVFLSSGIDSTAIAALASRAQGGVHTFTLAFTDLEFSEAKKARRIANRIGAQHRELTLSSQEMATRVDEAVASFDQPSMDGINTYFVSWAARQAGLKVALSGLGSDELFGGYRSFQSAASIARVVAISRCVPRSIRRIVSGVLDGSSVLGVSPDAARKAMAAWLDPGSLPHPYFLARALFTPQAVGSCLCEDFASWKLLPWWTWLIQAVRQGSACGRFTEISWLELRSYLLNTLLRDTDAMSMRHSLEVRVPFLDLPLVEYVLRLPDSHKLTKGRPKALLIEALGDVLPEEILTQPKRAFTLPWENWLRGALGERIAKGLADWSPVLAAKLGREFPMWTWRNFLQGRTSWSRPWSLYVLNEWTKRNLQGGEAEDFKQHKAATVSAN